MPAQGTLAFANAGMATPSQAQRKHEVRTLLPPQDQLTTCLETIMHLRSHKVLDLEPPVGVFFRKLRQPYVAEFWNE